MRTGADQDALIIAALAEDSPGRVGSFPPLGERPGLVRLPALLGAAERG